MLKYSGILIELNQCFHWNCSFRFCFVFCWLQSLFHRRLSHCSTGAICEIIVCVLEYLQWCRQLIKWKNEQKNYFLFSIFDSALSVKESNVLFIFRLNGANCGCYEKAQLFFSKNHQHWVNGIHFMMITHQKRDIHFEYTIFRYSSQ